MMLIGLVEQHIPMPVSVSDAALPQLYSQQVDPFQQPFYPPFLNDQLMVEETELAEVAEVTQVLPRIRYLLYLYS